MIERFEIKGYKLFYEKEGDPRTQSYLINATCLLDTFPDDEFLEKFARENNLDRIKIEKVYDFLFK